MEIEIRKISTEIIKPASPTPKSLQKHQLSFLDQSFHAFMPFVYLYQSNPIFSNSQKSNHLKKSLSQTLSRFYPLAGRLVDDLYVDCHDGGVPFAVAEADCDLSQVIADPDPANMNKFLPYNLIMQSHDLCMAAQATYFRCGGLAVGLLISHKIADAISLAFFANTWSAFARHGDGGGGGLPLPKFDAAVYFPPLDISGFKFSIGRSTEELTAKIFTFPAEKIAALRERYSGGGQRPSGVQALSAFIWTRFISATGMNADPVHKMCTVRHAMNLRSRIDPPLPEYLFGNIVSASTAKVAVGDGGAEVVRKVGESMKAVSGGEYVGRLKGGVKGLRLMKEAMEKASEADKGEVVNFTFSSLCGFPFYEADFGWGRPVLVRTVGFYYKNSVIFMDAKTSGGGDGIEALICLAKQDMDKFQAHFQLPFLFKSNL